MRQDPRVTALLHAWRAGDDRAYGEAVTALYGELKRRAANCLRGDRARDAMQATALVSETFIRLAPAGVEWRDRVHFLAVATTTMRRVLVDLARARAASKRGSRPVHVTLPADIPAAGGVDAVELLALDDALMRLAVQDERKARVVELRRRSHGGRNRRGAWRGARHGCPRLAHGAGVAPPRARERSSGYFRFSRRSSAS